MRSSQTYAITEPQSESEHPALILGTVANKLLVMAVEDGVPYQLACQNWDGTWNVKKEPLPNKLGKKYKTLVTGVDYSGSLHVLGLGIDGKPSLVCTQDNAGTWHEGKELPNSQTYKQLATGVGDQGFLQLVGLGEDGKPSLACYLRNEEGWKPGVPFPNNVFATQPYQVLATSAGHGGFLHLVGLDEGGKPCLMCWLDGNGSWRDGRGLPNSASSPAYQALVTGVEFGGGLNVVGLGTDGQPYLVCRESGAGYWEEGKALPNFASPQKYKKLATAITNGRVLLVGLGEDGKPYLPCYLWGGWQNGVPLPNVSSNQTYRDLFLMSRPIGAGLAQVMGIDEDGHPYLVCWQDGMGEWRLGTPLRFQPGRIVLPSGSGPTQDIPLPFVRVSPYTGIAFVSRRSGAVTFTVKDSQGNETRDLFGGSSASFTVPPGGPWYQVVSESAPLGTYTIEANVEDSPRKAFRGKPDDTMKGTIEVSRADKCRA